MGLNKDKIFSRRNLSALVLLLILLNLLFLFGSREITNTVQENNYDLLSPDIADKSVEDFLQTREEYVASYRPLRMQIENMLGELHKAEPNESTIFSEVIRIKNMVSPS